MKRLILPLCAAMLAATSHTASADQTYRVRKGDSLYRIAKSLKVDLEELKTANPLSSTDLRPGMTLVVPSKDRKAARTAKPKTVAEAAPAPRRGDERTASTSGPSATHTVRKGDTLAAIARQHSVSMDELRALNHLGARAKLKVGAVLALRSGDAPPAPAATAAQPAPGPEARRYTVRKGDTAWKISRKFNLTVDELVALNQVSAEGLKVGQELVVSRGNGPASGRDAEAPHPGADTAHVSSGPEAQARSPNPAPRRADAVVRVVVARGDTLQGLARRHGTSADALRALNGLKKKAKLKVGTTLIVRREAGSDDGGRVTYVVRRGDNLKKIARKFQTTPEELTRLNALGRRGLKVGQRLMVAAPTRGSPSPEALAEVAEMKAAEATLDSDLKSISTLSGEQVGLTERVIRVARRMLDIPYKFGGNSVRGIDCSAYVQKVFRFLNVPLPRTAREQFNHGLDVPREELARGDLVFFKTYARFPSHVGIYLGNNKFIHASSVGKKVTIDSLEAPYYSKRFIGGKRLVDEPAPGEPPAAKGQSEETAG